MLPGILKRTVKSMATKRKRLTARQRARNIKRATSAARKQYDRYEVTKLREIYNVFKQSANDIELKISRMAIEGKIPPERLQTVLNMLTNEMLYIRNTLNKMIPTGISDVIDFNLKQQIKIFNNNVREGYTAQIGSSYFKKSGEIARYNPRIETYVESQWYRLNTSAVQAVMSWNPAGETLSDRIWKIAINGERALHQQTRIGVILGESADTLSQRIRPFLIEPDKLFRRVRIDGKLVQSKAMQAYTPGRGVYKSSYKNAMRVARTSYSKAYTEGIIQYSMDKPFIRGWISRVGSGNPAPYDAMVNGTFFPKSQGIDIPYHPHCMCHAEIVTADTPESQLRYGIGRDEYNRGQLKSA
jgi:hypothetical protein